MENASTCPYNAFCGKQTLVNCRDTLIISCADCNVAGFIAVIVLSSILSLVIVFGNIITITVFVRRWKSGSEMKANVVKLSLAVCDLATG